MSVDAEWLLVVDVTVDERVEDEWNRWYDEVHLPELASCPGFLTAGRYVAESGGGRRYLSIYGLQDPTVLEGEEFDERRGWAQFGCDVQATVRVFRRRENEMTEDRT